MWATRSAARSRPHSLVDILNYAWGGAAAAPLDSRPQQTASSALPRYHHINVSKREYCSRPKLKDAVEMGPVDTGLGPSAMCLVTTDTGLFWGVSVQYGGGFYLAARKAGGAGTWALTVIPGAGLG